MKQVSRQNNKIIFKFLSCGVVVGIEFMEVSCLSLSISHCQCMDGEREGDLGFFFVRGWSRRGVCYF